MGVSVCGIDHINVCMCGVMCVCYAQHTTLSANHQKFLDITVSTPSIKTKIF